MSNYSKHTKYILLLLVAIAAFACTERDLERRPGREIVIDINWIGRGPAPTGAVFYFYPKGGGNPTIVNTGPEGFRGDLPNGEYQVLVFSTPSSEVNFEQINSYPDARIVAPVNGTSLLQPGFIYMGNVLKEKQTLVIPDKPNNIHETIDAFQQTHRFNLVFKVISTPEISIDQLTGSFLGVPPWVDCSEMTPSTDRVKIDYTTVRGESTSTMKTTIRSFGYNLLPNAGDLYMKMIIENLSYELTLDLTDILQTNIDQNDGKLPLDVNILIILTLGPGGVISGTATVADWEYENGSGIVF